MGLKKIIHNGEKNLDEVKFTVKDRLGLFDPVIIYPYRGYGNQEIAFVPGRILEKERVVHGDTGLKDTFWNNIKKMWKRYESDEIPGVEIVGELKGVKTTAVSDKEGFFTLRFQGLEPMRLSNGWHQVNIRIAKMPFDLAFEEEATGEAMISGQQNAFGVISDVDDTIIKSHAMHTPQKIITMLSNDAASRAPFEGVEELYRRLINNYENPLFFVSGSSYNLYDMLVAFCNQHRIPKAPFFLRDLGLEPGQWIKRKTTSYKTDYIERILGIYNRLPFICIGDSGQDDPEIYASIHDKYPGRLKAIYIRHVHTDERKKELEAMARGFDIPFLIMSDTKEAIEHAKKMNWIKQVRK